MVVITPKDAACIAIKAAGGASSVARKITELNPDKPLTPQAVQKWAKTRCPAERVLHLEKLQDKVKRFELRPDIYEKSPS